MIKYQPLVEDSWVEGDGEHVNLQYITFLVEKDRVIIETQGADYKKINIQLSPKTIKNLYTMVCMR